MIKNFRTRFELRLIPQIIRGLLFNRVIFIFSMGKVGSTSILLSVRRSLQEQEGEEYHSKYILFFKQRIFLQDFYLSRGFSKFVAAWRAWLGLPIKIICPIREPIAREVSGFFDMRVKNANADLEELEELFMTGGRGNKHKLDVGYFPERTLNWFDEYFKPLTRIDVYKEPFPIDRKWQIYNRRFTQVLLYRTDLKLSEQAELISRFLGIKLDEIRVENAAKNKTHAELYSRFRESVKMPEQYIRRMHDSRFARHFWSPAELKAVADKWRATSSS